MAESATSIASAVAKLSIQVQPAKSKKSTSKKAAEVVDDWENELDSDEDDYDVTAAAKDSRPSAISTGRGSNTAGTNAPPPTPISPTVNRDSAFASATFPGSGPPPPIYEQQEQELQGEGGEYSKPRPEKTDAVARRMIASALGMKMPKRTEEQREYDKAMREKERKRRMDEREAQKRAEEEAEKAKKAIWDD